MMSDFTLFWAEEIFQTYEQELIFCKTEEATKETCAEILKKEGYNDWYYTGMDIGEICWVFVKEYRREI